MITAANKLGALISYSDTDDYMISRHAVCASRDSETILHYAASWELKGEIQALLFNGEIWGLYVKDGVYVAETVDGRVIEGIYETQNVDKTDEDEDLSESSVVFPFYEVRAIRSENEVECERCDTLDDADNFVFRFRTEHDSLIQAKRRGYDAIHVVKIISDNTSSLVEEIEL